MKLTKKTHYFFITIIIFTLLLLSYSMYSFSKQENVKEYDDFILVNTNEKKRPLWFLEKYRCL